MQTPGLLLLNFPFTPTPLLPCRAAGAWDEVCVWRGCVGSRRLPAQQRDDLTCMAGELHKNVPKCRLCEAKRARFQNN